MQKALQCLLRSSLTCALILCANTADARRMKNPELINPFIDGNLRAQFRETLLLVAKTAFYMTASSLIYLERAIKNTFSAIQTAGRTTKYPVKSSNHVYLLRYRSYETP